MLFRSLGWKNNIPVTPGQTYTVVVGAGGAAINGSTTGQGSNSQKNGFSGGDSYFINYTTVVGYGGSNGFGIQSTNNGTAYGGGYVGDGGGNQCHEHQADKENAGGEPEQEFFHTYT